MHIVNHLQTWQKIVGATILLLGTALLFLITAKPAEAQSACTYTDDNGLISGITVQKRQVSSQSDREYSSSDWTPVACGSPNEFSGSLPLLMLNGKLLPGQSATVTVNSEANLTCIGDPGDFCEARVLLNGEDMAPDQDHFHWVPVSSESNWGNYSFSRSKNIECPLTLENILALGCEIGSIQLEIRNTDSTLHMDSLNIDAYLHPQTLVL